MHNHYETGGVPPHQMDVLNKCPKCGATWIGSRKALCSECSDKLGCLNHECKSRKDCGRFMHGDCDGEFEPRLHSDRCDWYKEMNDMRNKEQDLKILADAFFAELTMLEWEYGGIGLNPKRPFGNSDVEGDMLELLDWEPEGNDGDGPCYSSEQRDYVATLYREKLIPYLREQWSKVNK